MAPEDHLTKEMLEIYPREGQIVLTNKLSIKSQKLLIKWRWQRTVSTQKMSTKLICKKVRKFKCLPEPPSMEKLQNTQPSSKSKPSKKRSRNWKPEPLRIDLLEREFLMTLRGLPLLTNCRKTNLKFSRCCLSYQYL